jgi:hypothetical protein
MIIGQNEDDVRAFGGSAGIRVPSRYQTVILNPSRCLSVILILCRSPRKRPQQHEKKKPIFQKPGD